MDNFLSIHYYIFMSYKSGKILNYRYEINRCLGEGATSTVYLVRDKKEVGQLWALKQLTHAPTEEERGGLLREVGFLSTLYHENLVRLVDYFIQDGWDFLVMERVNGPTLQEIIDEAETPLPELDVVDYAVQVTRVLGYLHRQEPPIVYRDLKPGNIMITVPGELKLIDLGIARHFNPMKPKDTTPLGTPGYCPPEQYGRGQTTQRSDIYSLGATFHHALTLKDPARFNFDFPPVSSINSNITGELERILEKCLQIKPEDRYPSTSHLYDDLVAHQYNLKKNADSLGYKLKNLACNYRRRLGTMIERVIKKMNTP